MSHDDRELDLIGAEALPGGLREIREADHEPGDAPLAPTPTRSTTPLVGLIALVRSWLGR